MARSTASHDHRGNPILSRICTLKLILYMVASTAYHALPSIQVVARLDSITCFPAQYASFVKATYSYGTKFARVVTKYFNCIIVHPLPLFANS